jgi:alkylation response protein AidB-like acyl-CoA dehydrogenase
VAVSKCRFTRVCEGIHTSGVICRESLSPLIGAQKIHVKTRAVLSKLEVELPNSLKPGQEVIGSVVVRNDEFRIPVENESSRFRVVVEGSGVARVIGGSAGVGVMTSSDAVAGDVVRLRFSATGFDGERPSGLELVRELVVEP